MAVSRKKKDCDNFINWHVRVTGICNWKCDLLQNQWHQLTGNVRCITNLRIARAFFNHRSNFTFVIFKLSNNTFVKADITWLLDNSTFKFAETRLSHFIYQSEKKIWFACRFAIKFATYFHFLQLEIIGFRRTLKKNQPE